MCQFFSFVTDIRGVKYYFNWQQRQQILKKELKIKSGQSVNNADSHSEICAFYKLDCDKVNKYEYNPLLKNVNKDQINHNKDKLENIKNWCEDLNFKEIVEPLELHAIINPLMIKPKKVTKKIIKLLKDWASVWNSVWDSVGDSVGDSVWNSVWDSVWDSVGDSVWDSIWDSVRDSVQGYIGSFFILQNWKYFDKPGYPFQSVVDLWNKGFIPSFDGKIWRLHSGKNAKVVFEIKQKDLQNYKG